MTGAKSLIALSTSFSCEGVLKPTTAMVQVGQRLDAQSAAFVKRSVVDPTVWAGLSPQARAFISSRGWALKLPRVVK